MPFVNPGADKVVSEIVARLGNIHGVLKAEGTWGSFAPLLAAHISKKIHRPILYIRPHIDDADKAADDLSAFGAESITPLPAWEGEEELVDATDEIRAERAKLVARISSLAAGASKNKSNLIITTSVQALQQPVPSPKALQQSSLNLSVGTEKSPQEILKWLVDNGFERVDKIDLPGQFAQRGGIVDIFAPLIDDENNQAAAAIRLDFFGDNIESIRRIDLDTQRSTEQINTIRIISATCGAGQEERELFTNILPDETLVVLEEPNDMQEVAAVYIDRAEKSQRLYKWPELYQSLNRFGQLWICRFAPEDTQDYFKLNIKSVQQFQHKTTAWSGHKEALGELVNSAQSGKKVLLYCEAQAEIKRVIEIIEQDKGKVPKNFELLKGFVNQGFIIESLNTIIISHHELFGQFAIRRRVRPIGTTAPVDTLEDLQAGDYVVHASYGIGRFRGITTIKEKDSAGEYLTLEYANQVKIQVSVSNIHLVQKYIGTSPKRPALSKVGSKKWLKQKQKVEESVRDMAAELLEFQAKRQALGGIKYRPDSNWQKEFEESFAYQETADQTSVTEQIKADMHQPIAMDRLLCGDVGYGKTEIAMRAAFKAVENGKQVAVLVPTTVLCVQHGRTFAERFANFPVCVEVLNRFKTTKQSQDIINRTRQGKVDILIGTHRLLSGDVGFKDLGLLIIDEEQRFGVKHKEKLKKMRVNMDILTMTATPIPRTLHMSLLGLRDISSLGTPPLDRRAVVTQVARYDTNMIKRAIYRELNRQGQIFFLHNRVKTIDKKAWELRKLFDDGDIKFSIAHGQMTKHELEKAMIDFVLGKTNVLVCTTIIESGLDIPNANTIFIDEADRFGLAELHQLRGRVGRYKHRAYAYMLLPKNRSISPVAAKRLKAIEEYAHLGAGFKIALRDLEIRGAGNILGAEQSGHIQMVGYQMYCMLLAQAVRKLRNEPAEEIPSANIDLGISGYIPKNYIPADRSRMEAYRKIAISKNTDELKEIEAELADVYGPIPNDVKLILELAEFRIEAGKFDIKSIIASGNNLIFSFSKDAKQNAIKKLFADINGKVDIINPMTIYLRLHKSYFEPKTLMIIVRKILMKQ